MQVIVSNPHLRHFIESQIKEGRFTTPSDVVEAALARLLQSETDAGLDNETHEKILRANAQIDRGDGRTFDNVAAELRSLYKH